jgi:hypothetical protein
LVAVDRQVSGLLRSLGVPVADRPWKSIGVRAPTRCGVAWADSVVAAATALGGEYFARSVPV